MLAWNRCRPRVALAHVALSTFAFVVISVGTAHAQAPGPAAAPAEAPEPPGYRSAIEDAIGEYEARNFAESRALFERAHALFPNARSLRGLGMAEFELRNYPASIYYLEQALAATAKPLQNELRGETEALLGRARAFVGRVTLQLTPPEASVVLNGTKIQLAPDRVLNLMVGDYAMEVSADGYSPDRRQLRVAGGEQLTVTVQLPRQVDLLPTTTAGVPDTTSTTSEPREGKSILASPWLWAAVGVAVAGAAVGIGIAVSGGDTVLAEPSGGSTNTVLKL